MLLVEGRNDLEQKFGGSLVDRDIAELIKDEQIKAFEFGQIVKMASTAILHRKTGHKIRDSHKEHPESSAYSLNTNRICKARLARTRRPEHDDVFSPMNKTARCEIRLRQTLWPLKTCEIIVFKRSGRIQMSDIKRPCKCFDLPIRLNRAEGTDNNALGTIIKTKAADR